MKRLAIGTVALVVVLAPAAPALAATLTGPASARVLGKVTFRATGLKPADSYALLAVRAVTRSGHIYRCAAFLAPPRRAGGTATFKGSVPDEVGCVPLGVVGRPFRAPLRPGRYEVMVCVPGERNGCAPGATTVHRALHIRH
jgi:hypothetical protein